jgi:hypothetical protein
MAAPPAAGVVGLQGAPVTWTVEFNRTGDGRFVAHMVHVSPAMVTIDTMDHHEGRPVMHARLGQGSC